MITNVYKSIIKHLQSVNVQTHSETIMQGEYIETLVTGTKQLAVFPLTMQDLRYDTNGTYTLQDRKFYELGSGTLTPKTKIVLSDGIYRIDQWSNRNFDGGFTVYVGKREPV